MFVGIWMSITHMQLDHGATVSVYFNLKVVDFALWGAIKK